MVVTANASPLRVVVPLLPAVEVAALLPLAADLAGEGGHIVLLAAVPVPRGQDLSAATASARAARRQLRALARLLPRSVTHEELVRAADSLAAGILQVAGEGGGMLLVPLPPRARDAAAVFEQEPYHQLFSAPVTDTVFVRPGANATLRSVLVSARGGPYAELALDVAQRLARAEGAAVTVLHVDVPNALAGERQQEQRLFQSLVARSGDAPRLRTSSVPADSVPEAVLGETRRHDLLVLGARIGNHAGPAEIGAVPSAALEHSDAAVLIVKSRQPVNPAIFRPKPSPVEEIVNSWFVEHTTDCREYANLDELIAEKLRRGLTIGVALLAGASTDTLATHHRVLVDELGESTPLVDDAVLFCPPDPALLEAAAAAGFRTCVVEQARQDDRGRLMYASLRKLHTDIVVWLDADLRNPHAKLVYGLAGPLVWNEEVRYVKGFYGLPPEAPDADLQNLIGEFAARPLLNLFFAELSGLIDPLGAAHAVRRAAAIELPIFSGAAAQLGLPIDVFERFGLAAISQVALGERIARPLDMAEANREAFSAAQIIANRLGLAANDPLRERTSPTIKLIHQSEGRFQIDLIDAREAELLPRP